jgi:hypothetical protein
VEIDNDTAASVAVSVYPAAASIVRGNFAFAASTNGNELSTWTSVNHEMLHLAPGGEAFDTVTINVPGSASSGERYGVLWAQVSAPPTDAGITLVNRVGVRMYLSIGPGGAPAANFAISSLTAERSATGESVVAKVHNKGLGTLDISGDLMLSHGPDGLRAGPIVAKLGPVLAPGVSEPVSVPLKGGLPRGPWRADLELSSGAFRQSAVATIIFPLNRAAIPPKVPGFPTLILVVLATLVLLVIAALVLLARRRRSAAA